MSTPIFDERLHQLRRDRALRSDGDSFLLTRAIDDCLDRLAGIQRDFATVLIVGASRDEWVRVVQSLYPAAMITVASGDELPHLAAASFDLCLSIGQLETTNDLMSAAFVLRHLLAPGGFLVGAIVGGDSLPRLRSAMLAADRQGASISPRVHPSIDGPSLAKLFVAVGLVEPVIDVDRVSVSYSSLDRLVGDLRAAGCTNVLIERSRRALSRSQVEAARMNFLAGEKRSIERFELLHFAAWAPGK